jgi:hypothetical protein
VIHRKREEAECCQGIADSGETHQQVTLEVLLTQDGGTDSDVTVGLERFDPIAASALERDL